MIKQATMRAAADFKAAPWSLAGTMNDYCAEVLDRLNLPDCDGKDPLRTLGVTSSRRGEGVSTLAAHLATAAAGRQDGRVILVDAHLSRPAAARIFGVAAAPGLAECLCHDESPLELLQPTALENLHVLSAGDLRGTPAQVFDSSDLPAVVRELAEHAALVIFDLPPARQASCLSRLAAALDGVLLVVEAEAVRWEAAVRVKELLNRAGARIVGALLNKLHETS